MIGPVSTTGRAMMASLQQAIDKGMPPDQAIQYVKGMATQGIAPLADLYSMMNQFQRLRQQQVQAPQTPPTIKDELDMMDQQQQMQAPAPMAQQGNIQQMQAPAPMAQPMDQGLGAIDAGQMEYPQFAGGGIVAFDEGGPVGLDLDKMSSEQLKILAADQDLDLAKAATRKLLQRSGYVAPQDYIAKVEAEAVPVEAVQSAAPAAEVPVDMMGSMFSTENPFATPDERAQEMFQILASRTPEAPKVEEAPRPSAQRGQARTGTGRAAAPKGDEFTKFERELPDLEKMRAERIERERANKTGRFSQADEEMAAFIKEQKEQYGASEKEARNNFWINAGASLMANNNPSFLAALGESVKDNYGNLVNDLKSLRKDQQALRLQEIQLQRAREQAIESGEEKDVARYESMYEKAQGINLRITETRAEIREKIATRALQERIASMRAAGDGDLATQYMAQWEAIQRMPEGPEKDKAMDAWQQKLDASRTVQGAVTASGASAQSDRQRAVASAVSDVQKSGEYERARRTYYSDRASQADKDKAAAKMRKMEQDAAASVGRAFNIPLNTGYVPTTGGMGGAGGTTTFSGW